MSAPQTVTVTWTDPVVGPNQKPLAVLYVFENDLTQQPPTQTYVGSAPPGAQTFTTPYALPSGAQRTYQVCAQDVNGNRGPMSPPSSEIDAPALPGAPTAVTATLN